jgi:hypothetical protein
LVSVIHDFFTAVRDRTNPNRVFLDDCTRRVLGNLRAAVRRPAVVV